MDDSSLKWTPGASEKVFSVPIVDVYKVESSSPDGRLSGAYYRVKPKDGVIVVPVLETAEGRAFVMVRQWRHGAALITTEFPSGIVEEGEELEKAAERELREETGYRASSISFLGTIWQNPAIMCNTCSIFTAQGLSLEGEITPDEDEYLERILVPEERLLAEIGRAEFSSALTASALFFHLRARG